ncbi:MAG: glycosyltransferase family 2 protein [Gemmatimonadales bacterium]
MALAGRTMDAPGKPRIAGSTGGECVWVVIPAYRETQVLGPVVAGLRALGWRVVVVDDGSDDGTAAVARRAGAWVLQHPVNLGQGAALRSGFAFALADSSTRYVVTFDADGQHDQNAVAELIRPLEDGETAVTLGSRFLPGASVSGSIPASRKALLRLATRLARWSTGLKLTDTHNGLRAFRREALERMVLRQDRMAHASEILTEIARLHLPYREIPVRVNYTAYSMSKGQGLIDAVSVLWDTLIAKAR